MARLTRLTTTLTAGTALLCGSSAMAALVPFTTTFGSNNDGLGGFTTSSNNFYGGYTTNAENVEWFQDNVNSFNGGPGTDTDGALTNNSLLQEFSLTRSAGNAYRITGAMNWSNEADRNSRQGLYLFGDAGDIGLITGGEDATGDISLQYDAEAGQLRFREGLDGVTDIISVAPADAPAVDTYFTSVPLTFQADISFVNNGGVDEIEIDFTLFNDFDGDAILESNTISATVNAAAYTGNFFGFAGRGRDDGSAGDAIAQYESFSIIQTAVPEPASLALLGLGGLLMLSRRRGA